MLTLYNHGGDWINYDFYHYFEIFCKYYGFGGEYFFDWGYGLQNTYLKYADRGPAPAGRAGPVAGRAQRARREDRRLVGEVRRKRNLEEIASDSKARFVHAL